MHNKAKITLSDVEFPVFMIDSVQNSAEIPEKSVFLAFKRLECAYNFDFYVVLYAFSLKFDEFTTG